MLNLPSPVGFNGVTTTHPGVATDATRADGPQFVGCDPRCPVGQTKKKPVPLRISQEVIDLEGLGYRRKL